MNCPFCNEINDDQNTFCVGCGQTISQNTQTQTNVPPPTRFYPPEESPGSVETAYLPASSIPNQPPPPSYDTQIPSFAAPPGAPAKKGRGLLWAGLGLLLLVIVGVGGMVGVLIWQNQPARTSEVLPDHLGMFVQTSDKVTEIKKLDVSNALEEKEKLIEDSSLPVWENDAGLILYAEAKDIPVSDLKLIPLDSIEDDGKIEEIDFQAVPIEGQPSMKRLRVTEGMAAGKYAFALLDGYLDDGKHKFWAFQVRDGKRDSNEDIARAATVSVKNAPAEKDKEKEEKTAAPAKPAAPPAPAAPKKAAPPSGARVGFCNASNVVLRGSPSLQGRKVGKLSQGQRIYVMQYSGNYDEWRGTVANWAYIQTESGARGWVFTPFVNY